MKIWERLEMSFGHQEIFRPCKNNKQQIHIQKEQKPLRAGNLCGRKRASQAASITLEAALIIPFFLIFFVGLLSMFEMLRLQNSMEIGLHQVGKKISYSAFEAEMITEVGLDVLKAHDSNGKITEAVSKIKSVESMALPVVDASLSWFMLKDYLSESRILESPIIKKGALGVDNVIVPIAFKKDYVALESGCMVHPYYNNVFKIGEIKLEARYFGHKWTGFEIDTGEESKEEEPKKEEPEEYVYMVKTEKENVFHCSRDCQYLKHTVHQTSSEKLSSLRNKQKRKYYPCKKCKPEGCSTIYYTDAGIAYHSSKDCTAIETKKVQTLPRKKAEEISKGPCSKCGH